MSSNIKSVMRLIHVPTLSFEEFDSGDFPPYAILSHRWEDEEVTYQDVINDGFRNIHKKGIYKILGCCGLATEKKLQYVWVDTCCIDRSSSAELSEAINSMFEWYRLARICFAYLVDVVDQDLKHSVWFSRSWTLQELVAPEHVHFFSGSWKFIGTKDELAEDVSKVTGISADVLRYKINIYDLSVARRMGWARKRQCRRVEDIAYSLLGIFDINMPLLYGEGKKAFRRLQEEIIKQIPDHTIFLWSSTPEDDGRLLSPSPDRFDPNCISRSKRSDQSKPFTVTNLGLSITVSLCPWYAGMDCYTGIYLATLECELLNSDNLEEYDAATFSFLAEPSLLTKNIDGKR